MKNIITWSAILAVALTSCSLLPPSSAQDFQPAEYASTTGTASSGLEIQIGLDDGAAISIPPKSINRDVKVTVERNPEKAKSLPPLPDGMLQLSDFYNFEIDGADMIGPVDLIIPIDESILPKESGIPFAMFPTSDGWISIPVEIKDGKATVYTKELGDPLIAWWFDDIDPETRSICDPAIALQVVPDSGSVDSTFQVFGQLRSPRKSFLGFIPRKPNANTPVKIMLIHKYIETNEYTTVHTDIDGKFQFTINTNDLDPSFNGGYNWVHAEAYCDPWKGEIVVRSEGDVFFFVSPHSLASETEPITHPTAEPVILITPQSPTDKIPVTNVVGMTFEDAQDTLESLGFNTTWIDGKSNLELGKIYSQAPVAGTLSVPHRTTVVIYRTTEVDTTPPECDQLNLTPEECANLGYHNYTMTACSSSCECSSGDFVPVHIDQILRGTDTYETEHIGINTYKQVFHNSDYDSFATITFTSKGFHLRIETIRCTFEEDWIISE